jgi:hypothetical protein
MNLAISIGRTSSTRQAREQGGTPEELLLDEAGDLFYPDNIDLVAKARAAGVSVELHMANSSSYGTSQFDDAELPPRNHPARRRPGAWRHGVTGSFLIRRDQWREEHVAQEGGVRHAVRQ